MDVDALDAVIVQPHVLVGRSGVPKQHAEQPELKVMEQAADQLMQVFTPHPHDPLGGIHRDLDLTGLLELEQLGPDLRLFHVAVVQDHGHDGAVSFVERIHLGTIRLHHERLVALPHVDDGDVPRRNFPIVARPQHLEMSRDTIRQLTNRDGGHHHDREVLVGDRLPLAQKLLHGHGVKAFVVLTQRDATPAPSGHDDQEDQSDDHREVTTVHELHDIGPEVRQVDRHERAPDQTDLQPGPLPAAPTHDHHGDSRNDHYRRNREAVGGGQSRRRLEPDHQRATARPQRPVDAG